jgi:Ca-activated chloride channel family protein
MNEAPQSVERNPEPARVGRSWKRGFRAHSEGFAGAAASIVALALVAASIGLATRDSAADDCPGRVETLTVAAVPEVAPAVAVAARELENSKRATEGSCQRVTVMARAAVDQAAMLRGAGSIQPDVWIPDSSIWVDRVNATQTLPRAQSSIAISPVVLAVSARVAEQLGWPGRNPDFDVLLASGKSRPVRLGIPHPDRSAAIVGAVLGIQATLRSDPEGPATLAATVRAAMTGLPEDSQQLLAKLTGDASLAVPVSEQAVWAHNADIRRTAVVAAYPREAAMALDYPFLVLTRAETARTAAASLLAELRTGSGRDALRAQGFRDVQGAPTAVLTPATGADPTAKAARHVPSAEDARKAVRTAQVVGLGSRLLAVIDVSGSMGEHVPGVAGATRLSLTRDAAAIGLTLYPDDAEIGLWVFSTNLTPSTDSREIVPIGLLGVRSDGVTGRERLGMALTGIRHVPGGSTGLYDTALAAVRAVRNGWNPERVNTVVLLTDGKNEDDSSITLAQLVNTLRQESDKNRPVPVVSIAYGPDSDAHALQAISKATGGRTYLAKDPRNIKAVFLDAVGGRS